MIRFFLLVTAAICMSGCSFFLPHYDPVAQARVEGLIDSSQSVFADAKRGKLTASETERFLNGSIGIVGALHTREQTDGQDQQRLESLTALKSHYEMLLNRRTSLRVTDAAALGARLAAVQSRYGTGSHGLQPRVTSISSDSTDTTTTTETNCSQDENDKDKDKDKCKRDRDGKKDECCDDKRRK